MRKSLAVCLLLVAVMLVGCQTQSWRGTEFEPGTGRDADTPWCVHSGLFELSLGVSGGFLSAENQTLGSDEEELDFETSAFRGNAFLGYMINDFWELGVFVETASESWDPDDFDSVDVTGFGYGARLVYNFSTVTTDIVPYVAFSGGLGNMTYEDLGEIGDFDADRCFGQVGVGVRFFGWEQVGLNLEAYYRYVSDAIDDTVDGVTIDDTVVGNEGGLLFSISVFF